MFLLLVGAISRMRVFSISKSGASVLLLACLANAQYVNAQAAWKPDKTVEIVVGATPGGGNDITARLLQKVLLESKLVESVQVSNKPGGNQAIAWSYLNAHAGDGHYVHIVNEPLLANKMLGVSPLDYTDFTPLALLFSEYVIFVARPDAPFAEGKVLVERMRQDVASVVFGFGAARGNIAHFGIGVLAKAVGVDIRKMKIVVFDSSNGSTTAALGGHIDVAATVPAAARQHMMAGRLRGIAMTSEKRLGGDFAQVPTWKELGVDAYYASWRCLIGPKGMSRAQIMFWQNAVAKAVQSEEWKSTLASYVQEPAYLNSDDLRRFLEKQQGNLGGLLVSLGMVKQ